MNKLWTRSTIIIIERVSIECRKTKIKVINTLANYAVKHAEIAFSFCSVRDGGNLCSQPLDPLISRRPQHMDESIENTGFWQVLTSFKAYGWQIGYKTLSVRERTVHNISCPVIGYKIKVGNPALTWVRHVRDQIQNFTDK